MSLIKLIENPWYRDPVHTFSHSPFFVTAKKLEQIHRYHRSMAAYQTTQLISLDSLAKQLGVARIDIKDESSRFGLKAFKALGASWALACQMSGNEMGDGPTFDQLISGSRQFSWNGVTTATDGNHGKGVAWVARQLGIPSRIFMPEGSKACRVEAIAEYADSVVVTDQSYDETVKQAMTFASENGYLLIQDTSWQGYEKIPMDIMQGYLTIMSELKPHFEEHRPTHVFLQAGVGTFAAAVVSWFLSQAVNKSSLECPRFILMEPKNAACFFHSLQQTDGEPHLVKGNLDTQMAGLACGMPALQAWQILKEASKIALACDDKLSSRGMWRAAKALPGDPGFVSGESAALGLGIIDYLCWPNTSDEQAKIDDLKMRLGLHSKSKLLFFSTEGDTDPEFYQAVAGKYSDSLAYTRYTRDEN